MTFQDRLDQITEVSISKLNFLLEHAEFAAERRALAGYIINFISCSTAQGSDTQTEKPESIAELFWRMSEKKAWVSGPNQPIIAWMRYDRYNFYKDIIYDPKALLKFNPLQYNHEIYTRLKKGLETKNYPEIYTYFLEVTRNERWERTSNLFEAIIADDNLQSLCAKLIKEEPRFKIFRPFLMGYFFINMIF
ncbi:MAG: hypothetical protein OMM_04641 [Candidatus Magnetoglobus multicellularis str. Araruama]|uniref:Uncharacterized protein n=1 Tax=Candidatus Magnetoglobus multicellularis str. Araruama TaxID=890399 RepID=A0A1V1P0G6_9BACT|nr:MAG: hypothetical protein OMM_04641 [Candidatus Magnetoglobus multicellularis str. Araruama]